MTADEACGAGPAGPDRARRIVGARRGAAGPRLPRRRSDRPRRRRRVRRPRCRRRPARGVDRRAGRRALPAAPARRRGPLRVGGRAALVEAVPVPPAQPAVERRARDDGFDRRRAPGPTTAPYAFVGVRGRATCTPSPSRTACSSGAPASRPVYAANRRRAFVVVVNCGEPGGTCFCVSMGTGPRATVGFDLALTELLDGEHHEFLVERHSRRGVECSRRLPAGQPARPTCEPPRTSSSGAAARMGREMDTDRHPAAPRREPRAPALGRRGQPMPDVRQLHAGVPDVLLPTASRTPPTSPGRRPSDGGAGTRASRSTTPTCTAGSVRSSTRSRYRQWLTHKLGTWFDQFGTPAASAAGAASPGARSASTSPRRSRCDPRRPGRVAQAEGAVKTMQTIDDLLARAPVLRRARRPSTRPHRRVRHERALPGRRRTCSARSGAADTSTCCATGRVAIEIPRPQRGAIVVATLGAGEVLGWSWLVPPYRWTFDARAVEPDDERSRSTACACAASAKTTPRLGYGLMQRFAQRDRSASAGGAAPAPRPLRACPSAE